MGLDKFLKDGKKEELVLTKKDYKSKVNNIVKNTFEKEDLDLLKAIAFEKNTTVNKVLMNIIKDPLKITRENLPSSFNINEKAKEYEMNSKKRKVEKKVETRVRKNKIK